MEEIEIEIDGCISQFEYSSQYIKSCLKKAGNRAVVCRVCSLGGDFMMGMAIKDEFARHGNVTVDISGYAASSATLLGLGAKYTRISDTSFYFIHKVMSWVEGWGCMNADEITALIGNLEKIADENEKMTLVAAMAYAEKCQKPVIDILNLMKKETWLTAAEAKEWGFVDEVYKAGEKMNIARISAKLNVAGLPALPNTPKNTQDRFINRITAAIVDALPGGSARTENENGDQTIQNKLVMVKFEKLNAVLSVPSLESADGKGVYLNEAQLQTLDDSLAKYAQDIADMKTNQAAFDAGIEKLNALHPDVAAAADFSAKLNVLAGKLAEKPSVVPSGAKEKKSDNPDDGVDWEKLNSLSHMKEDRNSLV